jgi:hypothetical protein
MNKGGRNLIILGISATIIAVLTTAISLIVYDASGDIYLDRSRPGFLPEKEEIEEEQQRDDYAFSEDGNLTTEVLDEFLEEYEKVIDLVEKIENPFSEKPLSDDYLGISNAAE